MDDYDADGLFESDIEDDGDAGPEGSGGHNGFATVEVHLPNAAGFLTTTRTRMCPLRHMSYIRHTLPCTSLKQHAVGCPVLEVGCKRMRRASVVGCPWGPISGLGTWGGKLMRRDAAVLAKRARH